MKKLFFILLVFIGLSIGLLAESANAQTHVLFGTCSNFNYGNGTIFRADSNGNNIHTVYTFDNINGADPEGNLVQAANCKIYGTTYMGGCQDSCVLFEYDPATGINLDVYDFYCNLTGAEPTDGMILGTDGNLYGMTWDGGSYYGGGIIYRFNPDTHIFDTLYNFKSTTGTNPYGRLLQFNNIFYGMTNLGGTYNLGVIFNFDLSSHSYDTLFNFDGTHGSYPWFGSLIQASNGKLYGMTRIGGTSGLGVIFSYDTTNNTYNELYNFVNASGDEPSGSLIQATNGKLYGMTMYGGIHNYGVIFSYDIIDSLYTVLVNFDGSNNGRYPYRELMQASNGKLYGTTSEGGLYNYGVAFYYDIITTNFTKLIDFDGNLLGGYPQCDIFETVPGAGTCIPVGIPSVKNTNPVDVFPSAATNYLTIHNANSSSSVLYTITDFSGQTILSGILNSQDTQIAVSSLSSGIYFITIRDNTGIITKKFIKE